MTNSTSESATAQNSRPNRFGLAARLAVLALVPLVLLIVVGAVLFAGRLSSSAQRGTDADLVGLGKQVNTLITAVQVERRTAAGGPRGQAPRAVDDAIGALRSAVADTELPDGPAKDAWQRTDKGLAALGAIRSSAARGGGAGITEYTGLIDSLLGFERAVAGAPRDGGLTTRATSVTSLDEAREELSDQEAVLLSGIARGQLTQPESVTVRDAGVRMDAALERFRAVGTESDVAKLDTSLKKTDLDRHSALVTEAFKPGRIKVSAADWSASSAAVAGQLRGVTESVEGELTAQANSLHDSARTAAIVTGLLVLFAVLAAAAVAAFAGRSLVRAVRQLRRKAREIARRSLPTALAELREGKPVSTEIEPLPAGGGAELDDLARSFDAVHGEARNLAAAQASLRTNYGTVFVNLSRRSQTLVQRQLRLIEQLERDEEDPDHLGTLFALDHLATRMRRNNENLMVLSGAEPNRASAQQPVSLEDLLRAAVSEIEQYRRVVLAPPPAATVLGYTAGDLVRLVAELLDNATAFSAPDTTVTVSTSLATDDSVLIEVSDAGIGMRPEELAAANERLAAAEAEEVPASRRMGLFVVGRLAHRQGVHVALRAGEEGGLLAGIRIPRTLLAGVAVPDGGLGTEHTRSAGRTRKDTDDTVETVLPRPAQPYGSREPATPPRRPRTEQPPRAEQPPAPQPPAQPPAPPQAAAAASNGLPRRTPKEPPERTPIFDSMLSAWFSDPGVAADPIATPAGAAAPEAEEAEQAARQAADQSAAEQDATVLGGSETEPERWRFAADAGWQAVEEVAEVRQDTFTEAGLPKRTPRARLLPGSVPDRTGADQGTERAEPGPATQGAKHRSADSVRSRLASFQRGLRQGRHSVGDEQPPVQRASADTELFTPEQEAPQPSGDTTGSWAFDPDGEQTANGTATAAPGGTDAESFTEAGLPRRRPKAQLVPGSQTPNGRPEAMGPPDANGVRSRLASFQRGLSEGRRSVGIPERELDEDQHAYQWENE
ncbi:nitrate- and nitrite sensing domain-containing protein [Sciscionella sediminilitoris]|uniref:nitrate- and nitrite sensing domain-containing protein n=1 Tax=Sciscionella sediminilitoris TaxID=1445613 RepID=UPI0004DF6949|nr:nitrate- and nitrite sensing domain-containing protein [Sciscionella sp. SE31]